MYMFRVVVYPQLGKERELQQHMEAWVKTNQGKGQKIGLSVQRFAAEGTVLVLVVRLAGLAEYEEMTQRNATDRDFQAFVAKTATLTRLPPRFELLEVVIPIPD